MQKNLKNPTQPKTKRKQVDEKINHHLYPICRVSSTGIDALNQPGETEEPQAAACTGGTRKSGAETANPSEYTDLLQMVRI